MTCHIIDRKTIDLSKTSGFAVTVTVIAYSFLRICALSAPSAICTLSVVGILSVIYALSVPFASMSISMSMSVFAVP